MTSKLLITGGDLSVMEEFLASGAGLVVLDLEDTVTTHQKPATRASIAGFLRHALKRGCRTGVRINPLSTSEGLRDLLALLELDRAPDTLVLTKVESAAEIRIYEKLLTGCLANCDLSIIIETPRALAAVEEIAQASCRISSISVGGKDLSKELGMERNWEPLHYARSRIVNAAAIAGIEAIDEPFHPRDDLEGLRENCRRVRAMGFSGKSATDPRHPAVINAELGRIS